jgi:hypothetical protein
MRPDTRRRGHINTELPRAIAPHRPPAPAAKKHRPPAEPGPPRPVRPPPPTSDASTPAAGAAAGCAPPQWRRNVVRSRRGEDTLRGSRASTVRYVACANGSRSELPPQCRAPETVAAGGEAPRPSATPVLRGQANREALATLLAAPVQHFATPSGAHARPKPVRGCTPLVTRPICRSHSPFSCGRQRYPEPVPRVKVDFSTRPHYVRAPCWTPTAFLQ